ncbi:MAG: ABC transporter ATP-binding protein [Coriobacteriia bacterium]|nr:ABC transporter ATP-binding protein [Coriobacteriia bacterium]
MANPQTIVQAKGLCKTFKLSAKQQRIENAPGRLRVAVDHLDLSANKGEIYGLLGPNGAGKTTVLRMLATLIKPDEGEAHIDGFSIGADPEKVRAAVGFLTSELKLEDFFTPDYLFGFFSTLHNVPPAIAAQRKDALFTRFGIDEFAQVKVGNLSTGMKQKASLVLSLVHNPDVIIFDEPTNGLDVITARVVTDYLLELRDQGKSIILSTHIFTLAEKLCDRMGIIINGRMVSEGTLEEVAAGRDLEEVFFDLYSAATKEVA